MIPKKIHYCWFGQTPLPKSAVKCVESWKKYCPDFEIVRWDEETFDIHKMPYTEWCFRNKKWAFLSDYARLAVVAEHGGVYFDTDVEVLKPFEPLLSFGAFYGYENPELINTGVGFGAESDHPTVVAMKNEYETLLPDADGNFSVKACPAYNTEALKKLGFVPDGKRSSVFGAEIFPVEFFNPLDEPTGRVRITENTYSIHKYDKSWLPAKARFRSRLTKPFHRLFGEDCFEKFKKGRNGEK